jgi:hypothetical protein
MVLDSFDVEADDTAGKTTYPTNQTMTDKYHGFNEYGQCDGSSPRWMIEPNHRYGQVIKTKCNKCGSTEVVRITLDSPMSSPPELSDRDILEKNVYSNMKIEKGIGQRALEGYIAIILIALLVTVIIEMI